MAKATVTTLGNLIILALLFSLSASPAVGDDAAPPVNIATMKRLTWDDSLLDKAEGIRVGPRGEKPKWHVQTQVVHNGPLRLEVPAGELESLQDFDVHVTLHSSSGVENGDKACATLSKLTIQAKGE